MRTAAGEPPSFHQAWTPAVQDGPTVVFQAEVERLHRLAAFLVGTFGLGIHDVEGFLAFLAP